MRRLRIIQIKSWTTKRIQASRSNQSSLLLFASMHAAQASHIWDTTIDLRSLQLHLLVWRKSVQPANTVKNRFNRRKTTFLRLSFLFKCCFFCLLSLVSSCFYSAEVSLSTKHMIYVDWDCLTWWTVRLFFSWFAVLQLCFLAVASLLLFFELARFATVHYWLKVLVSGLHCSLC